MSPSIKQGVLYIQYGSELLGVLAKKQCFSCHTFCHGSELLGVLAEKNNVFLATGVPLARWEAGTAMQGRGDG